MNRKKQFLTLILSLTVILSMMPFSVFADNTANTSDQADPDVQAAQQDVNADAPESEGASSEIADATAPAPVDNEPAEPADGENAAYATDTAASGLADAADATDEKPELTEQKREAPRAGGTITVILYDDGEMVFQGTDTPDPGRTVFKTYSVPTTSGSPAWEADNNKVKKVTFKEDIKTITPVNGYRWFYGCADLTEINGLENLNTSEMTDMGSMFQGCEKLAEINGLENFDTSKVKSMTLMFRDCKAVEQLNVENWNVENVTSLQQIFTSCSKLKSLDLSKWNSAKNTDLSYAFYGCSSLTDLNIATMNTSSVTNLNLTFYLCTSLKNLDVSDWNTSNVTTTYATFNGCSSLESIDVSGWDTSKDTNMSYMFGQCNSLKSMDISNFSMASATDVSYLFGFCPNLETVVLPSNTDASKVTTAQQFFAYCTSLKEADMSGMKFSDNLTVAQTMFARCENLETLDISSLNITNCQYLADFLHDCTSLKKITIGENFKYKQSSTVSGQLSNGFPSGIWLYDGDNTKYKATDIVKKLETGSMPGTFTKVAEHAIQASFPAQYKIGKIYKIDDLQIIRKRGSGDAIKEWNPNWADDGMLWMKVDGSELDPDDDTLRAPYTLVFTFKDAAEDVFGNKYDLQLKYDNIILYQAKEIVLSNGTHLSEYYHELFRISKEGNICVMGEDRRSLDNETDPDYSPNSSYDLTLTITDGEGNPQQGHYIFSIYDLDISSFIDYQRREAGDTETTTPSTERKNKAYGLYSEGVYLKDGFELDTLTCADNTYLHLLGKSSDGKWDGYRVMGTQVDSSSELTDLVIRADAAGSHFTWTGWSCEDFLLYKYQPEPVYFHKVDQFGSRVDGAKLELYRTEDIDGNPIDPPSKVDEWTTDSSKNADYTSFMVPGKYLLKEVQTPEGYETSADVEFIIDTDYDVCDTDGNKIDGLYDKDGTRHAEMNIVSMTDKRKSEPGGTEILISKVNEKGKAISGAVFEVYKIDGDREIKLTQNDYRWLDAKGQFTVGTDLYLLSGLEDGRYEIREVKAPEGYRIRDDWPVTFTVKDGKLDASQNTLTASVKYEKVGEDSHLFTVTNSSEPGKGVKTGDNSNIGLWITLMFLAAAGLAATILYRRRRE